MTQCLCRLFSKIVKCFTRISDQRGWESCSERKLVLVGGPAALWVSLMVFLAAAAASAAESSNAARTEEAFRLAADKRPASWTVWAAGDLGMILDRKDDGLVLASLFDLAKHRQLLAQKALPLFVVTLRSNESKEQIALSADAGWEQVQTTSTEAAKGGEIRWRNPKDKRLGGLCVTAVATLDPSMGAIRWKLNVDGIAKPWSIRRVVFPQALLDASSPDFTFFYPLGCGLLRHGSEAIKYGQGTPYPNGWVAMQFMAAYDSRVGTGIYFALHDPQGRTKEMWAESRPADKAVVAVFDVPAENMDQAGNTYALPGEAVWQVLHGDWFDAAMIYRKWVRQSATWFPKLGPDGRVDTPLWMRELSVWLQMDATPKTLSPEVAAFAKTLGIPVGFHWYNWHQIPFDNDYPHFLPAKEGFGDAVRDLLAKNVYVMPYINGRLWDTRDKGMADFEFTRLALPAATKDEAGKPYVESYESKEADGSPVRLAVMCPSTDLWQTTVRRNVSRLMNEEGVKAVYIDQIAAAPPVLCFDHAHAHATGGGSWWVESYNKMLGDIRKAKPADSILTTECNAEPFLKNLDGYLTWHWGFDGQVPAFPAVYGGAIQMFGRAYRDGETKELALRMKVGQQLTFGEQIGWFHPNVMQNQQSAEFLKQAVGVRWQLRRYFHAGEMARPPKLQGVIPTVRADWKWTNPGWVTTDAVMTGAWTLSNEHRCILLFANVSDQPVTAKLQLDATVYGLRGQQARATVIGPAGAGESFRSPMSIDRDMTFAARSAFAWELTPIEAAQLKP